MEADFFDETLRNQVPSKIESSIQYYTMGKQAWHTTAVWPPRGLQTETLYFKDSHALKPSPPAARIGSDSYTADYSVSSGMQSRWYTQIAGGDVVYPNRSTEDKRLLTYTTDQLQNDLEITGSPVLTLAMSSTESDGAVHAYLEDVAPTGRVTYLDEGVFRLIDRKEVDPRRLPYPPLGPAHSFFRKDAEPMKVGEIEVIRFALLPTSLLLRKGHSIRIALAGTDAGLFQRYPATGIPVWTVYREAGRPSFVELPVMTH
jgi:hypothetical protein